MEIKWKLRICQYICFFFSVFFSIKLWPGQKPKYVLETLDSHIFLFGLSEVSNQPVQLQKLARLEISDIAFICMYYLGSKQQRHWSDCANVSSWHGSCDSTRQAESRKNLTAYMYITTWFLCFKWAPSSEFVSWSIPSWQTLTAHAQPFRGARDLSFWLKVPLDLLLVWASSGGSGETARLRRLAWTFAARIGNKYQIRLTRPKWFFVL